MIPRQISGWRPRTATTPCPTCRRSSAWVSSTCRTIPTTPNYTDGYGKDFFAPNLWPERPARMRPAFEANYRALRGIGDDLMRIFAIALQIDERWFDDKIARSISGARGDTASDGDREPCTFSFHTAFRDPATPPDARDRQSIEVRCVLLYD